MYPFLVLRAFVNMKFLSARIFRQNTVRYLLREWEHFKRKTGEVSVELPDRVHVEHIYPQTPSESNRWANHDLAVSRLGNMTLLSRHLNTSAKNKPFSDKLEYYEQSDLLITRELTSHSKWGMLEIEERQRRMREDALSIWTI